MNFLGKSRLFFSCPVSPINILCMWIDCFPVSLQLKFLLILIIVKYIMFSKIQHGAHPIPVETGKF